MGIQEIFIYVALAVLIAMMFNNSRKRKKQMSELQSKIVEGATVTLYSGIIGQIVSITDDRMVLESTPGTKLTVAKAAIRSVDAAPVEKKQHLLPRSLQSRPPPLSQQPRPQLSLLQSLRLKSQQPSSTRVF